MADVAIAPRFALDAPMTITSPTSEKPLARWALMAIAFVFLGIFLLLPLVVVFAQAFRRGAGQGAARRWPIPTRWRRSG